MITAHSPFRNITITCGEGVHPHAPKPWKFDELEGRTLRDGVGTGILKISYLGSDADAALIEAAPDLLEACRLALAYIEQEETIETWAQAQDALVHAIAKAERRML